MRSRYRIFVAAALIFSLLLPVQGLAAGTDYKQQSDFWTWIAGKNSILQDLIGYTSGAVCPKSEDGYHHASSYVKNNEDGYYTCICSYCGERFVGYEDDAQQSYDSQVSDLPASGVTSSGNLIVTFYPAYISYSNSGVPVYRYFPLGSGVDKGDLGDYKVSFNQADWSIEITKTSSFGFYASVYYSFEVSFPFNCKYSIVTSPSVSYSTNLGNEKTMSLTSYESVPSGTYVQGEVKSFSYRWQDNGSGTKIFTSYLVRPLVYTVIPADTSIVTNNYTINSRPTSITGDYGIIGDNGQITKVDSTTIVNETNNTYTNPSTGTTSTITDWTYDYSDRSYDLTLDTGDTVTVTYGDENVTIQEGDTVYNIYYIVDGTGQGTDPGVCQHNYTSTVDREATCTVPGQTTYTCSLCGHTYTETIPAKGHTWTILQTVTTEYDEEGNLLQQGYTLYQCSVCGEQYKDEAGTGPPGSDSSDDGESIWDKLGNFLGSIFGGLIGLIEAILGAILDALTSLATMIGEKLAAVVELVLSLFTEIPVLFTGFLGFLTAVFPFLPEEVMLLLTFGIAVIVFIGIIKALRR